MFDLDKDTGTITFIKKDTASFTVSLDNHELTDGDVVLFTVAPNLEMEEPSLQKRIEEFNEDGSATINILANDTRDMEIGTYLYDVQVNLADGRVDTFIGPNKFKLLGGVTY